MKVYCKRTYLMQNTNLYSINGKNYGEYFALWEKGKLYKAKAPVDYEQEVGIYYILESERESIYTPIKEREFRKHFVDVDELREHKINKILKVNKNNDTGI